MNSIEFDIIEVKILFWIMASRAKSLLFVVVLSSVAYFACGHVALTFPPARKYDFDFLDNSRTAAPCGVPKGKKVFLLFCKIFDGCQQQRSSHYLNN